MSCDHKNLILKNNAIVFNDAFKINDFSLQCSDCGVILCYIPKDVNDIKNIPHLSPDQCDHSQDLVHYCLNSTRICLKCGKNLGITSPITKLKII